MMKVVFLYYRFFDFKENRLFIGGAESYIFRLSQICQSLGWDVIVFQISKEPFDTSFQGIKIVGVKPSLKLQPLMNRRLYSAALNVIDPEKDLIVFGADLCSVNTDNPRCISINHGVFWDYPTGHCGPYPYRLKGVLGNLYKKYVKARMRRLFDNCSNRVCVDYNMLNWYRTAINDFVCQNVWVIPNFCYVAQPQEILAAEQKQHEVSILFARRFAEYRGTRIMAEAAKAILQRYQSVKFTFAGEGPDENFLKDSFVGDERVSFTSFKPNESVAVNLRHDISVIPSLGAEGTSLSVAEAMGAGRAIIATNVGGIPNMIIHGYNGLLIDPNPRALEESMSTLVENEGLRKRLGRAAYETAIRSFSYERWRQQWLTIFQHFQH